MRVLFLYILVVLSGCANNTQSPILHVDKSQVSECFEVNSCVKLIHSRICNTWNLPESTTKDLRVKLRVVFSTSGEVINALLVEGSGNAEFDESALKAINLASPFSALSKLDETTFVKYFSKVTFVFNPEIILANKNWKAS